MLGASSFFREPAMTRTTDLLIVGPAVTAQALALALTPDFLDTRWTTTGAQALEVVSGSSLVLVFPRLPDMAALLLIERLHKRHRCRTVFLPQQPTAVAARVAAAFGATAASSNACGLPALQRTLAATLEGRSVFFGQPGERIGGRIRRRVRLTNRQLEVLALLAGARLHKVASANLRISEGTFREHLDVLRDKLEVPTNDHLVPRALELGLLPADPT